MKVTTLEEIILVLVCIYLIAISVIKLVNFFSYDRKLKKINLLKEYKNLLDNKILNDAEFEKFKEKSFHVIKKLQKKKQEKKQEKKKKS